MDDLQGTLTAYEMRTCNEENYHRENSFKTEKKNKEINSEFEDYIEEENFVRKLKKRSGKYKGKLPFKCFNYGKIGHFSTKCPYDDNDKENI